MPMRQDCKQFESRTYPNGDTVRKCNLNLAPEAPWRCPEDCGSYERRLADVAWKHGSLVTPAAPEAPKSLDDEDAAVADLLSEAASIVNAVGAETLASVEAEQEAERLRARPSMTDKVKKFFRRRPR